MAAIAEAGKEATVPCITAYDAGRCFKVCRVGDGIAFVIYEGQALGIQQKARHSGYVAHVVYLAAGVCVEQLEVGSHLRILPWLARQVELDRSEEHTSELQSRENLVCRLLLEKKKYYK